MKVAALPPTNNMGAEITSAPVAPKENQILIDWLSWTLKTLDPEQAIKESGLSCMTFTKSKGGGMGYKASMRAGNVVVFYDGSENMGCHISMTGQGCRQYEAYYKKSNVWYSLLHRLRSVHATVTRIDYALDNVDGSLDIDQLEVDIQQKDVRSKFKGGHKIENFSFSLDAPEKLGKTIYIGAPSSRIKFRFYDKAAQMCITTHWVRCEIQCRAERAEESIKFLLKDVPAGHLAVAILNNYFAIINQDDSNRSRCSLKAWWSAWLTTTDKIKLTTAKALKEIEEVLDFLRRQYAPTFAMCKQYLGVANFSDFMHELIDIGKERMTKKHEMILACSNLITELPF